MAILYDPQRDRFRRYLKSKLLPGDWGSQFVPLSSCMLIDDLLEAFSEDITPDVFILLWPEHRVVELRRKDSVHAPYKRLLG